MSEKKIKRRTFSGEFKQSVVEEMRENKLSYKATGRLHGIHDTVIADWERVYLEEGVEGLYIEKRGRARKNESPLKGRPSRLKEDVEEDLIGEVQRLRMENEYLKKLNALVRQKEISAKKIEPK